MQEGRDWNLQELFPMLVIVSKEDKLRFYYTGYYVCESHNGKVLTMFCASYNCDKGVSEAVQLGGIRLTVNFLLHSENTCGI